MPGREQQQHHHHLKNPNPEQQHHLHASKQQQQPPLSTSSSSSSLQQHAVTHQPVPNFNSYLPPSPPRSRSPSPYNSNGRTSVQHAGAAAGGAAGSGPRLRNATTSSSSMSATSTSTLTASTLNGHAGHVQQQQPNHNHHHHQQPHANGMAISTAASAAHPSAMIMQRRPSRESDAATSSASSITHAPTRSSQLETGGMMGDSGKLHSVNVHGHHAAAQQHAYQPYTNGVNGYTPHEHAHAHYGGAGLAGGSTQAGLSASTSSAKHAHFAPSPPPSSSSPTMPAFMGSLYSKANGLVKELPFSSGPSGLPTHSHNDSPDTRPLTGGPSSSSSRQSVAHGSHAHARRKSIAQAVTPSISTVRFVSLCALWYTSSALSSNTGKAILMRFKYPVTLTFIQFGFVAGWCVLFCVGRTKMAQFSSGGSSNSHGHHHHARALSVSQMHAANGWGIKKPTKKALEGTLVMSGFQIAGHIFSSMAIARVPVSTVHTIKALSPLFTVMSYGLLFGVRYSSRTYIALLPLTLGVMLACSFDLRANAAGLVCALGSTLVFVSQNIFSKKLLPKDGGRNEHGAGADSGKLDKLHLLLYSSGLAFLLMIPLWAYYDGYKLIFGTDVIRTATIPTLMFYYTLNGSVHFLQNLLAFSILSICSPVTYSIASLIKRIAVICMAIVWFGQNVYGVQALGISMTFVGLWMYNQSKKDVERGESVRTKVERRGSILLPTSKEDLSDSENPRAKGWGIVR